jgi:hypothetical protein
LVRKTEGIKPLGRTRRRWENAVKINLEEMIFVGVNWIYLALDRVRWRAVLDTKLNLRVP